MKEPIACSALSLVMRPPLRFLGLFLAATTAAFAALDQTAYNAAVELYTQHKPEEAQKAFEALADANPENPEIPFYLGRLALQRDDHEQAVKYLEKAVALAPTDSHRHVRLGDAYGLAAQKAGFFAQIGWARKCHAEYEKAVELDPKSVEARWSLMEYCRQAPGVVGGGNDKALVQALEIKKLDPERGRFAVASVYAADKKFDEAFAEFEEYLRSKPGDYAALFQVGRLAAISGAHLDRGVAVLQQCLTLPTPENQPPYAAAHWRLGNIREKQGDKTAARAEYEAALKADPKFSYAADALKKLN